MAESNGLLNRRTGNNWFRGFESLSLRQLFMRRFWATKAHGPPNWMCNTGSVFEPSARKIFWGGKYAATSCGRIGRNGASGSATNENDPFWGGFSGFGQAERAAEPPRGPRIESPAPPSEPPTALRPACGAPLPDPRSPQPVLAARDLATPPLAGGQQPINPLRKTGR